MNDLNKVEGNEITLATLKQADIISNNFERAKIVLSKKPELTKAVTVRGLGVTKGAKAAIEAAGGKVEE